MSITRTIKQSVIKTFIQSAFLSLWVIATLISPSLAMAQPLNPTGSYSISGKVTDSSGLPVPDVTITVGGVYNTKTNSNGEYTVSGLSQATYSVKPSINLVGVTFSPSERMVTVPPSATGQDFTVTYVNPTTNTIQGRIVDTNGVGVADVTVTAQNKNVNSGGTYTTKTNSSGDYQFTNLPAGNYQITPSTSLIGMTFDPLSRSVTLPPSASNQNFTLKALVPGNNSIKGKVTDSNGNPVADVTITASGGYSAKTGSNGEYSIENVPDGSYVLTPTTSLIGITFSPATRNVTVPPSATGQNFTTVPLTACQELIKNGSFEADSDWYLPITVFPGGYSNDLIKASAAAFSNEQANSGSRSLRVGIVDQAKNVFSYSSGWQQVTMPSSLSSANLKFYLYPLSVNGIDGFDVQLMIILNNNKMEVQRPVHMQKDDRKWIEYNFDMKKYAGQTIWVYFGVVNNGIGANMAMYVDDVSLLACP